MISTHCIMPCVSGHSRAALALSILLSLLHLSAPTEQHDNQNKRNPHPCMTSSHPSAYDTFLKRHLPQDQPDSLDQNQWQAFIKKHNLCQRPTQSFLRHKDKQQVLGVCSPGGGRTLEDNMCISGREFTFVTVRLQENTCDIKKLKRETKHLILACDDIDVTCRPVHFEGNPKDLKPDKNHQPPCERPRSRASSEAELPMAGWASVLFPLSLPWLLWH